jgi:ATP-binding cassette, subfamily B, multidrug efflux pump
VSPPRKGPGPTAPAPGQAQQHPGAPHSGPAHPGAPHPGARAVPRRLPAAGQPTGRGGPPWMSLGAPSEKSMNFWPSVRRLLGHFRAERLRIGLVLTLALASVALSMVGPLLIGRATDIIFSGAISRRLPAGSTAQQAVAAARAAGQNHYAEMLAHMHLTPGQGIDFHTLGIALLWVVVLYLGSSVCAWGQGYVLNDLVQGMVLRMRGDVEAKIHRLPLRYFDQQPRGELLSRVTNDISNVSQTLQQTLSQLLNALLTVLGVLAMMFWVSPLLALVALVTIPLAMMLTKVIAKRSQGQFIAQWTHTGELNSLIEEAFTGHELVKVFGRQREVNARFDTKNEQLFAASFAAQFISGTIMPAVMFVGNINYVLIAVIGGLRVATGAMSLGAVQAFIQYSRQFTRPLTQVASMANTLQSGVASAERVYDLLDASEQSAEPAEPQRPASLQGRVAFEHASFRYEPDKPLIEDLSLVAEPGHTIAIVGPTGAGKTTLVNLIMRFYELNAGRITLDEVDIRHMRRDELRARIGMVLQDAWLFHGTIRENLRYGRPEASDAEIIAAAQATFVDRFVRSLPAGYDTMIDEESSNLSAGQKQLMTIARAFLTDPALLILDEATSSVDSRTEALVQHAMAALRRNRTSFVIAHRLSTIRDADLILVMRDGAIVEQGNHEQLLARRGAYFDLYNAQFTAPLEEEAARSTGTVRRTVNA